MQRHPLAVFIACAGFLTACSADQEAQSNETQPNAAQTEDTKLDITVSTTSPLIETISAHSFEDTVAKLRASLEERPVTLFAEIDHAKGAANADLELAPSILFIFGNPKGGTPLMTREPRMGIELPLKMHVFETDGQVIVAHADMAALAGRYGLDADAQPIPNIAGLLDGLTKVATQ